MDAQPASDLSASGQRHAWQDDAAGRSERAGLEVPKLRSAVGECAGAKLAAAPSTLRTRVTRVAREPIRPRTLLLLAAIGAGLLVGLGAFTFRYAEGTSYLSDNPAACANCHIMEEQYSSWTASSHSAVAGCVDCHLPHATIPKYISKAENGWFHSVGFTLQNYPEPIRIKPRNRQLVQANCATCHQEVAHTMAPEMVAPEGVTCMHCHREVGHAAWR
jgi:cytochrome c nitrite reductase small subunit